MSWAGRNSGRLISGQSLRACIVFRQERTEKRRAVFRSRRTVKKNQRQLKAVKFLPCGKIQGWKFEFYPIENAKLLKNLKSRTGWICNLDDFGHFAEDWFARDQWRAADWLKWKMKWDWASMVEEERERSWSRKTAGPEDHRCAGWGRQGSWDKMRVR